jgi:hypothetical protein
MSTSELQVALATALAENTHHMGRFFAASAMAAGWLRGDGFARLLDPEDYGPSQAFAGQHRGKGADGIVYPSVRHPPGQCIAAFYPDVVRPPAQGDHFRYYWDGSRVAYARKLTGDRVILAL